mgnify:CR=1 FL=1
MANESNTEKKGNKPGSNLTGEPKPRINIYWVYALIALAFIGIQFFSSRQQTIDITWKRFEQEMLKNQDVEKIIVVNKEKAEVFIKPDRIGLDRYKDIRKGTNKTNIPGPHYVLLIGSVDRFDERLEAAQKDLPDENKVSPLYENRRDLVGELIGWLLPVILLVVIWIFLFRRFNKGMAGGSGNIFNVGKSKATLFDKESKVKINFNDVAGLEEAKVEIKEIVDFLKNPKKYTELGGKIPKGVLLIGPPGTGKTLLAKAVAGEAHVPFFSLTGSDFVEMFVGVGASRVRDLFAQSKVKAPCIVFIDEIDAIGRARGRNLNIGANDERENTLNQLLSEMDGFGDNSGVIVMAATNRVDILDRALLRAGRFDRQIHVELPDLNERRDIFKVHIKPLKLDPTIDLDFLARQTPGFSGADIANVCNEAALIAARREKKEVGRQDFLDAVDRIVAGLEKKNKIISRHEKRTIAYHEAGHATASWFLKYANPLVKVTIVPRGRALGAAWYLPEERQITTTEQLFDDICVGLSGRAAEEMEFGHISTGALNDLERVTKQAYAMVSYFGMSKKIGHLSFYDSTGQSDYFFAKPYSNKTAETIDEEVHLLIDKAYERAKKLLKDNKDGWKKLAEKLLETEVIFKEDLELIFGKRPFDDEEPETDEKKKKRVKKQDAPVEPAGLFTAPPVEKQEQPQAVKNTEEEEKNE